MGRVAWFGGPPPTEAFDDVNSLVLSLIESAARAPGVKHDRTRPITETVTQSYSSQILIVVSSSTISRRVIGANSSRSLSAASTLTSTLSMCTCLSFPQAARSLAREIGSVGFRVSVPDLLSMTRTLNHSAALPGSQAESPLTAFLITLRSSSFPAAKHRAARQAMIATAAAKVAYFLMLLLPTRRK